MITIALLRSPSSMPIESPYHIQTGHCIVVSAVQAGHDVVLLSGSFEVKRPFMETHYMLQIPDEGAVQRQMLYKIWRP